jgi:hypothetical protein
MTVNMHQLVNQRTGSQPITPMQANRLRILKGVVDRAFRKMIGFGKKRALHKVAFWRLISPAVSAGIDVLFSNVSGQSKRPTSMNQVDQVTGHIIARAIHELYTNDECKKTIERLVLYDLYDNGGKYELMAQMPPARRERTSSKPRTLIESRADRAVAKVAEWEKKLKLAKTKLAKYRARVKRYAKKGVIENG